MSIALLDISDSNLQLWSGEHHLRSPGYALHTGKEYLFGREARATARLEPRSINTRYWWQLSTEPLQPALGPARHTGDLVHGHLQQLHREAGKPAEMLLAVSGSMQREQLALLLGIAQQCPFDVVGLVNRSVALGSLYGGPGRLFHLEVQLHQAVISELAESGGQVEIERTVPLPGCGLLQLQERLVEIIATSFIRQTRFDPRRKAATEQQLYDALPDTLRVLQREGETNIELNGYRARVTLEELSGAGQRLFDGAPQTMGVLRPDDRVLVDPIAALLPGLSARFPQMQELDRHAMQTALEHHMALLVQRGQPLNFITTLPCMTQTITPQETPAPPAAVLEEPAPPAATHLLHGDRATPLLASGTALGGGWELLAVERGWQLRGSGATPLVNDEDYRDGQLLGRGDRIAIGDQPALLLIEVCQ
jgi:hypothetical protein